MREKPTRCDSKWILLQKFRIAMVLTANRRALQAGNSVWWDGGTGLSLCFSNRGEKSPLQSTPFKTYRRNLPHWYPPGAAVFVTWRLAGTLPSFDNCAHDGRAFAERDLRLDRTIEGPQWLRQSEIAQCVLTNLHDGSGSRYELHAFVVMPNHVHVLLTPWIELATITRAMKGKSARQAMLCWIALWPLLLAG